MEWKITTFSVENRGDLHHLERLSWLAERTKERTTEQCSQPQKNSAAVGHQGPLKIELLKVAGQLKKSHSVRRMESPSVSMV